MSNHQCDMCGKYSTIDHLGTPGELKWIGIGRKKDEVGVYVCYDCQDKISKFMDSETINSNYLK